MEIFHEILDDEFIVLEALTGLKAIALAEKFHPRIVVLDIMLPDIDGFEVCRKLRRMSDMRDSRIVMVSAKAMPSDCAAGMRLGADSYLTKPFDDSALLAAVRGE
jgi:DNA-binding response OmpR family regulator